MFGIARSYVLVEHVQWYRLFEPHIFSYPPNKSSGAFVADLLAPVWFFRGGHLFKYAGNRAGRVHELNPSSPVHAGVMPLWKDESKQFRDALVAFDTYVQRPLDVALGLLEYAEFKTANDISPSDLSELRFSSILITYMQVNKVTFRAEVLSQPQSLATAVLRCGTLIMIVYPTWHGIIKAICQHNLDDKDNEGGDRLSTVKDITHIK